MSRYLVATWFVLASAAVLIMLVATTGELLTPWNGDHSTWDALWTIGVLGAIGCAALLLVASTIYTVVRIVRDNWAEEDSP